MKIKTVLLSGAMHFTGHLSSTFKGPIKKGLRPIAWYSQQKDDATSCYILSDIEINEGETKRVQIVLLNEFQLSQPIIKGMILRVGTTLLQFAEFIVEEHLGVWSGDKVP